MKVNWRTAERIIWSLTILVGILFYVRDEAAEKAITEHTLADVLSEVDDINKKLDRHESYWINQNQINGRVITYIDIDSRQ